jgi:hypothetical protein
LGGQWVWYEIAGKWKQGFPGREDREHLKALH